MQTHTYHFVKKFLKSSHVIKYSSCLFSCLVAQSFQTLCDPTDSSPPGSSVHKDFSRPEHWSGLPCPPPGDLPNPGMEHRSPTLQADSLPSEPPGKPKNTGVGTLTLLQGMLLTQESNWGLLHCRQVCYKLSYQESPYIFFMSEWVKSLSRVGLFATSWTVACTRLLCPWDILGKSTGEGCRFLLQGIFPTQGLNPGLPHCRQMLYHLSHQGSQIFFISIPK